MNQQCRSHLPCNSRVGSNSLQPPESMLTPVSCTSVYRKKRFRSRFRKLSSWWHLWVGRQLAPGSIASFFPLPLVLSHGLPIGVGHHQGIEIRQGGAYGQGSLRGSAIYQIPGMHAEERTFEEGGERIKGPSLVYSGLDILPTEQSRGTQSSEKSATGQPEGRGTWCRWSQNRRSLRGTHVNTLR
jgi:hypothetical protein